MLRDAVAGISGKLPNGTTAWPDRAVPRVPQTVFSPENGTGKKGNKDSDGDFSEPHTVCCAWQALAGGWACPQHI
ncbi:hypothetical protein CC2G_012974 [Coprinopsis cinerea AmutBmut pab1-1]|nr:hypothetical protein CC2G_012974 [Coprinopsis cinerea AmutBmut pab1-1]